MQGKHTVFFRDNMTMPRNPYNPVDAYDWENKDFTPYYLAYPEDERFFSELIANEWALKGPADIDKKPPIYWNVTDSSTRDNTQGGSIYIYCVAMQYPQIMGIDYDGIKHVRSMTVDIQVPTVKTRNEVWTREVVRILNSFRRAGRSRLNGWDYLEITQVAPHNNYLQFYHTTIDFKLTRMVTSYSDNGFGHDVEIPNNIGQIR